MRNSQAKGPKALSAAWQTRKPEQARSAAWQNSQTGARKPGQKPKPGQKLQFQSNECNPGRGQSTGWCLPNTQPGQRPKHWVLLDKLAGRSPETRPKAKALSRSRGATKERTIVLFAVWACLMHDAMSWCIGDDKQGNVLQQFWSYVTFTPCDWKWSLDLHATKNCDLLGGSSSPYHPQSHWTGLETSQVRGRWNQVWSRLFVSCLRSRAVWCCASGFQKPSKASASRNLLAPLRPGERRVIQLPENNC